MLELRFIYVGRSPQSFDLLENSLSGGFWPYLSAPRVDNSKTVGLYGVLCRIRASYGSLFYREQAGKAEALEMIVCMRHAHPNFGVGCVEGLPLLLCNGTTDRRLGPSRYLAEVLYMAGGFTTALPSNPITAVDSICTTRAPSLDRTLM